MTTHLTALPCDLDPADTPAEPVWHTAPQLTLFCDAACEWSADYARASNGAPYLTLRLRTKEGVSATLLISDEAQAGMAKAVAAAAATRRGA